MKMMYFTKLRFFNPSTSVVKLFDVSGVEWEFPGGLFESVRRMRVSNVLLEEVETMGLSLRAGKNR